jgi:hypothetical protein
MGFFRFYFFLHKLLFLCHGQVFLLFNFTNECWSPLPSDTQDSLTLNLHQSLLYPHNIRKLLKGFHRQKKKKNPTRPAKGSYVTMKSTGRFVNHRWIDTNSPKTLLGGILAPERSGIGCYWNSQGPKCGLSHLLVFLPHACIYENGNRKCCGRDAQLCSEPSLQHTQQGKALAVVKWDNDWYHSSPCGRRKTDSQLQPLKSCRPSIHESLHGLGQVP